MNTTQENQSDAQWLDYLKQLNQSMQLMIPGQTLKSTGEFQKLIADLYQQCVNLKPLSGGSTINLNGSAIKPEVPKQTTTEHMRYMQQFFKNEENQDTARYPQYQNLEVHIERRLSNSLSLKSVLNEPYTDAELAVLFGEILDDNSKDLKWTAKHIEELKPHMTNCSRIITQNEQKPDESKFEYIQAIQKYMNSHTTLCSFDDLVAHFRSKQEAQLMNSAAQPNVNNFRQQKSALLTQYSNYSDKTCDTSFSIDPIYWPPFRAHILDIEKTLGQTLRDPQNSNCDHCFVALCDFCRSKGSIQSQAVQLDVHYLAALSHIMLDQIISNSQYTTSLLDTTSLLEKTKAQEQKLLLHKACIDCDCGAIFEIAQNIAQLGNKHSPINYNNAILQDVFNKIKLVLVYCIHCIIGGKPSNCAAKDTASVLKPCTVPQNSTGLLSALCLFAQPKHQNDQSSTSHTAPPAYQF